MKSNKPPVYVTHVEGTAVPQQKWNRYTTRRTTHNKGIIEKAKTTEAQSRVVRFNFLKQNSRNLAFFKIWLSSENLFTFLVFSWLFYMLKLPAQKLHTIFFLNHFPLREISFGQLCLAIFLPPRVWARRCQPLSWLNTVDTRHVCGLTLQLSWTYEVFGCEL